MRGITDTTDTTDTMAVMWRQRQAAVVARQAAVAAISMINPNGKKPPLFLSEFRMLIFRIYLTSPNASTIKIIYRKQIMR
jgi:hypothetical protein